jgi:hypothetical protein
VERLRGGFEIEEAGVESAEPLHEPMLGARAFGVRGSIQPAARGVRRH